MNKIICKYCKGLGAYDLCQKCNGFGYIRIEEHREPKPSQSNIPNGSQPDINSRSFLQSLN